MKSKSVKALQILFFTHLILNAPAFAGKKPTKPMPASGHVSSAKNRAVANASPILVMDDKFEKLEQNHWAPMTHTFGCNETVFNPANVKAQSGKLSLVINNTAFRERQMSGAELRSNTIVNGQPTENKYFYGRFEARMKSTALPGAVSSVFLYRSNPWQEIDIEFLGSDPRKIQFNVYFNEGDGTQSDTKGDSIQFPLDFDASAEFHDYAIEWEPGKIRWYIDGKEIYNRASNKIPNMPMTLRLNHWLTCSDASDWAGVFEPKKMPAATEYQRVRVWQLQ